MNTELEARLRTENVERSTLDAGHDWTLLVAESQPLLRKAVADFATSEGWRVVAAECGLEAAAAIATQQPDVAIISAALPNADSREFLLDLRGWCDIPVIVLSETASERAKLEMFDAGADDFVTRPFSVRELLARARAQARRWRKYAQPTHPAKTTCRFGNVEIDRHKRLVRKAGEEVHLTRTEYRLFSVFVAHPERVLTQAFLQREIWGAGQAKGHNLRLHIRNLRCKLEDVPHRPTLLCTEPRVGYRLRLTGVPRQQEWSPAWRNQETRVDLSVTSEA